MRARMYHRFTAKIRQPLVRTTGFSIEKTNLSAFPIGVVASVANGLARDRASGEMSRPAFSRSNLLWLTLAILAVSGGEALALEKPEYSVVAERNTYEIRRYEPYIVAEVEVSATSGRRAGNKAFGILAGYIFGDNVAKTKMAMTAPVESTHSERMSMTAPVETTADGDTYTYAFVMEKKFTLETSPEPVNPDIRIRVRPGRYVAALRYSGSWSDANYLRHENELEQALATDAVAITGPFTSARYNSPFALPMIRRNEVLVEVEWNGD